VERILIFANRYSGAFNRVARRAPLAHFAREAGLEPEIVRTQSSSQLYELLKERVVGKERKVAIAGGDGTVHTAAQALARTDVVMGILPLGTANNFATALRLPMDLPSAFRAIAAGEERAVSLGLADDEYFTEAAGVGIFADALVLSGAGGTTKSVLRTMRAVFHLFATHRPLTLDLTVDGRHSREKAVMVAVANSFRLGLALPIAPTARLTDEELDVVIMGPLTRREMILYYHAVRAQSHIQLPKVRLLRAREIRIDSPHSLNVHVDDRVRKRTPVTMQIVPDALRVMVDRL
jgi:YegS/Rv2252/BmrU family lipid kinase